MDKVDEAIKNLRKPFRHYPRCSKCPLSKDLSLMYERVAAEARLIGCVVA